MRTLAIPVTIYAYDRTVEVFHLNAAGEGVPEHKHPYEHILYLTGGDVTFYVGGIPMRPAAPAQINLPAETPHSFEAHEPSCVVSIFITQS